MVAVHYPAHWWYRGEELRHLTVFEYNALISVVPLKDVLEDEDDPEDGATDNDSDTDDSRGSNKKEPTRNHGGGRSKRKHFRFHRDHPLSDSHTQCLKAKQPTLIFNSYVPDHPGIPPPPPDPEASPFEMSEYKKEKLKWEQTAKTYAKYYSILFLEHPHIYGDNKSWEKQPWTHGYLSWDKFFEWIQEMEQSLRLIDYL
jgi:hypothetical protein